MPINTNLTTIPAKSMVMPLGSRVLTNDVGSRISFDSSGNVVITLPMKFDALTSWHGAAGGVMPMNAIAISNNPTPNITVNGAVIDLTIVNQSSLGVTVSFLVNGNDAGKQQNPSLEFIGHKHKKE